MSSVRAPVIAGLVPGSGTSTLAAALHAVDAGVLAHRVAGEADVVVCRAGALRYAAALACSPSGPRPVLAVLLDQSGREAVAPRLAAVRARFSAVTALPHVPHWQDVPTPLGVVPRRAAVQAVQAVQEEAATVLALSGIYLVEPVRAYAAALRVLVAALADTGVLRRSSPPMVSRPVTEGMVNKGLVTEGRWPGLHTAERATPLRPVPITPPAAPARATRPPVGQSASRPAPVQLDELDDEALESLLPESPAPAGRAR